MSTRSLRLALVLLVTIGRVSSAQAQQSVTSLTLINANTDLPVAGFDPIPPGATIDLAALPTLSLNIRANTAPATVGSVRFKYDATTNYRTDSAAPYAIASETSGNYAAWTPALGSHTVTATPYTAANAGGTAGTPYTLTFFVTRSRINAGGSSFTDGAGKIWTADSAFTGGGIYTTTAAIAGTTDDTLFQSERSGTTDSPGTAFSYALPVPSGTYAVTLYFAEIYWTSTGKRLFNVSIEGQQVLTNLDIFAQVGANTALSYTFQKAVTDGTLNIAFTTVLDNAKVSAIEVVAVPQGNQPPVVNAGADKTISLPTTSVAMTATASDDGLPAPPAAVTYAWSLVTGPAAVTFSAPAALSTNASFTQTGTYTLRLTVSDSVLITTDDVVVTVNSAPVNQPPVVNAGVDKTITLPTTSVAMTATASDDGLPAPPASMTYAWSLVTGPAAVAFSAPSAVATNATFTLAGTYTLRLTVSDSVLTTTDDVVVTVSPAAAFTPIRINAGGPAFTDSVGQAWAADKNFSGGGTYSTTAAIAGTVEDTLFKSERTGTTDVAGAAFSYNIPVPSGTYSVTLYFAEIYWTSAGNRLFNVSLEGQQVLTNLDIFAQAGTNAALSYTFQKAVTDGTLNIAFTTVLDNAKVSAIQVVAASVTNQAPSVNAGADKTITLPATASLSATANDDGLPAPPSALTYAWSVVSGPGTVTYSAPTALTTTAGFSVAGTYTLRLTASDSVLSSTDDVVVTVNPAAPNQAPVVNAGADKAITLPTNAVSLTATSSDDGLPAPPSAVTYAWSSVSGPAAVTFSAPAALTTTATFTTAGTYTLRLTASDSALSASDDVVVTVNPAPPFAPVLINAGGPAFTDSLSQVWAADKLFTGGSSYATGATTPIAGTVEDTLYRTERSGNFSYAMPVPNGTYVVTLHFAEIYWNASGQRVFNVLAEGQPVLTNFDIWANVGMNTALDVVVDVPVSDGVLNLDFVTLVDNAQVAAIEVRAHPGDPFLHVVIGAPAYVVDYDGNGSEAVTLTGSGSHTHELGHHIVGWTWKEGATVLGTSANLSVPLGVGTHTVSLTIQDDNSPPHTLSDSVQVPVYPLNAVSGALARYYPAGGVPVTTLIDALPSQPGFVEVLPAARVDPIAGKIGGSPYASNVVATLTANYAVAAAGTYQFVLTGGTATRFFVNGAPASGPLSLAVGSYAIEARFAVPSGSSLPAEVMVSINGAAAASIAGAALHHDETGALPFVNSMTASGSPLGGESVTIGGFGFFPSNAVTVHWGGAVISSSALVVTPTAITLTTPPGTGSIAVSVQTPSGTSNSVTFTYTSGVVPVVFTSPQTAATPANPTQAAWGPDGRLYVGTISGQILAYTLDDNYAVTGTQVLGGVSALSNPMILGIAFNPADPPSPVRIYVSHSALFAKGGACFSGAFPYPGQVSRIDGPSFSTATPIVTGLPVSNHDHGVNGLLFDGNGDLLIAQGGNTNAGVAGNCNIGQTPESPLSAAILKARLSKPGFNGAITYKSTSTGQTQNDQSFGDTVDVAPGVDVSVWAPGFRNPFDIVLTPDGRLFGTDNGPNDTFGAASTSATTQAPDPTAPDQIERVVQGGYYGHPNRNRGRYFPRENIYRAPDSASAILGQYTAPLATVPSSTNGIDEYRATTFNGAMRGNLLAQQLDGQLYRAQLNAAGTGVTSVQTLASSFGLDVVTGPGGAILGIDYNGSQIKVMKPIDAGAPSVVAYDIFPWRGRTDGTTPFVIGGAGFSGSTSVTVGGTTASVTSVSPTRIKGLIPAKANAKADLLDVVVQTGGQTSVITKAFRYVLNAGAGTGLWTPAPNLPQALGEVSAGIIDGVMYVVGSNATTYAYDLATETWQTVATRPRAGDHHAAEVVGGKLYLFGGFGASSEGQVQIYNPATNSWSLGAPAPFATGAASTAVINGLVYMAGGIVSGATVNTAAVYNPATNAWTPMASMPAGRNYGAAGTDGTRLFVFGGRGPGSGDSNVVAEGFDDVQIYDPGADAWQCSCLGGSTIPPLPQKRGGTGKAAFFRGEFYVMGGETTPAGTGQVAGNVYNRVDVFNPVSQTWRLEATMPTARHGIFPLAYDDRIFVAGGGIQAGTSVSDVLEILTR